MKITQKYRPLLFLLIFLLLSCGEKSDQLSKSELELKMNQIAENYVKLVLEIGLYRTEYVDAYYGPEEWKPDKNSKRNIDSTLISSLNSKADNLLDRLEDLSEYNATELETLRYRFLYKQLLSIKGMIAIISGAEFPFEKEAQILYDSNPPQYDKEYFYAVIEKIDRLLPGIGNLTKRYNRFIDKFIIPKEKIDTVLKAAMNECRRLTNVHLILPENENFKAEYVNNKPWGAYNWFKGNYHSVIQLNTDLPITINRVLGLSSHEGYPGHHVFNLLLEKNLVKDRGWVEYSIYPLYSPISLLAEGTANFGEKLIFPGNSKVKFMKEALFPLANLDTSLVEDYQKVLELVKHLSYADDDAARNFLNGKWNREETIRFLTENALHSRERAEKKLDFIEFYRSYVINYYYGFDLVTDYIERNGGTEDDPERRWELFKKLLATPQTPSGLLD